MIKVTFAVTKKSLGATALVAVSVGYQHGWHLLPLENDQGAYNFPGDLTSFVLLVQIQNASAGGSVAIAMKRDGVTEVKPAFSYTVTSADAASGEPVLQHQVETL